MPTAGTEMGLGAMTRVRVVCGSLISIVALVGGHLQNGRDISSGIQLPAFIMILSGIFAASVPGGRRVSWRTGIGVTLLTIGTGPRSMTDNERLSLVKRLLASGKGAVGAAVIAQVMGLVHVMENLDRPEMIGPGIALAFVASVYGALLWALFAAIRNNHLALLQERTGLALDPETGHSEISDVFISIFLLLFAAFVVLYALSAGAPRSW